MSGALFQEAVEHFSPPLILYIIVFFVFPLCFVALCFHANSVLGTIEQSPSSILPDLLENEKQPRLPSPSSSFLPHLALDESLRAEATEERSCAFLPPPLLSEPGLAPMGSPPCFLEGDKLANDYCDYYLFTLGSFSACQTYFTFTHRDHKRRITCTRKLALPYGFSPG